MGLVYQMPEPDADGLVEQPLPFDPVDTVPELGTIVPSQETEPFTRLICGDVIDVLKQMDARSVHCVVTSPPYMGLRDYGIEPRLWTDGSRCVLGDEATLEHYVQHLVEVFHELKRVLHPHGSCWLNIGDAYAGGGRHHEPQKYPDVTKPKRPKQQSRSGKDLLMVPAHVAIGLQRDGWIVRQAIVWAKALSFCAGYSGSVMPESTRDRCTWAYEYVYHLVPHDDYFYDQDGCREAYADSTIRQVRGSDYTGRGRKNYASAGAQNPSDVKRRVLSAAASGTGRNLRNVWVIPKQNFPGGHFATFPEKLIEPVVKLATSEKGYCSQCGEQVRRRVIREPVPTAVQAKFEASRAVTRDETGRTDGHTSKRPNYRRKVLREEWEPGCTCGAETVPSVVMDIFAGGSGRAGLVAKRLGRSFIGIDVKPEYIEMTDRIIRGLPLEPTTDKQAQTGNPTYTGFNKRYAAKGV